MDEPVEHGARNEPRCRSAQDQRNHAEGAAGDLHGPRGFCPDLMDEVRGLLRNRRKRVVHHAHRSSLNREEDGRGQSRRHSGPGTDVARANVGQAVQHPASQRPGVGRCCPGRAGHKARVAAPGGREPARKAARPTGRGGKLERAGLRTRPVPRHVAATTPTPSHAAAPALPLPFFPLPPREGVPPDGWPRFFEPEPRLVRVERRNGIIIASSCSCSSCCTWSSTESSESDSARSPSCRRGSGIPRGFVAQDVQASGKLGATMRKSKNLDGRELMTLDYQKLSVVLWGVVKSLQKRVEKLEKKKRGRSN